MSDGFTPLSFTGPGAASGFRGDVRFAESAVPAPPPPEPAEVPEDPLAIAWTEGYATGVAEARAEAEAQEAAAAHARHGLALSFARLDRTLEEELRLRLRDTVAALCEQAIAPCALDEDALLRRIDKAVAMLARADDDRVIRLHPEDIALLSPRLPQEWHVLPDAALERGALRVESATGGVEDGPAVWRRAIAEALHQC